ncbi:hypothetical protein [Rhodocyclus purpureus]|uniref:hypothetical protein n=1 Tax=Rhodocyclus purpureus TaxID=1067 RepID=UPI00191131B9|nr:hypothetical protein [Rhodocyclus purpureus]MBK5913716.1 hypothetical protein [Rhodocyclus purpureus]
MEFLTCIVAAEEDEYPALAAAGSPLHEWSGVEVPGFDTLKLATLHSLLMDESLQAALDLYEPVCVAEGDNETLVLRVDAELFEKLVELDEESLESVATELAATEAYEDEALDAEDIQDQLISLVELAQLAESQDQVLFVWIKLLQR